MIEIRKRGRPRTRPLTPEATHLIAWRERYGLTQEQAADVLCVKLRTYRSWEEGFGQPGHLPNYLRLASAELERERTPAPDTRRVPRPLWPGRSI